MVLIKDVIVSIFGAFWGIVEYFVGKTTEAGVQPDPVIVVAIVVVLTIWICSASLAGTVAGMRERSIILHGFIGMLLPLVYPALLLFTLDIKGARDRAKARIAEEKRQALEEEERLLARGLINGGGEEDDIEEERSQFNSEYFTQIARNAEGELTGPWAITFGGNEIIAERIVDQLDEVVVVEIRVSEEEVSRIRIPYAKITSCEAG